MINRFWAVLALVLLPFAASATERGTAQEAQAMLDRVAALHQSSGLDAVLNAVKDPDNGDFHDRDLYVFVLDYEGNMLSHGANAALIGRNLLGVKDSDGNAFIVQMIALARGPGSGTVDYHWPNPQTKKIDPKTSFVLRLDDGSWAGVGIYSSAS